jgi:hypothetical protein
MDPPQGGTAAQRTSAGELIRIEEARGELITMSEAS